MNQPRYSNQQNVRRPVRGRKKFNPLFIIFVLALIAVILTGIYIYFSVGYRYITNDEGIKFLGIVKDGVPYKGKIYYPDGSTSNLDLKENKIVYSNKDVYIGDIVDLTRHGTGEMRYAASGDIYNGPFVNDSMTGYARYSYAHGDTYDVYEGDVLNSKRHGKGLYKWSDGSSYNGDYADNMRDGEGVFTGSDGSSYTGTYVKDIREGKATSIFPSGDTYVGDFKSDRRTGYGVYTFANGDRYEGEFVDNKMNGKGAYYFYSGRTYEGYFKDGRMVVDYDEAAPEQ